MKKEGKMQNKWPKHAWENRDIFAQQVHPGHTRGIQLLKHQNLHKCVSHEIRSVRQICTYLV